MSTKLTTITLSDSDFQVVATREKMEALGLEVITKYDGELGEEYIAGYYLIKNGKSYYCEGKFRLSSMVVEIN